MCLGSYLNNSRANILANRSEPLDTHVMYPTMHQSIMQRGERKRQHIISCAMAARGNTSTSLLTIAVLFGCFTATDSDLSVSISSKQKYKQ